MQQVRLSTRLAVYFAVCFLLAGLATIIVVNMAMRQQAMDEARDKARIILDHNLAIHTYFTHQLKPHVFPLTEQKKTADYFDPVWMSSTYAVREIHKYFNELNPRDYFYKDVNDTYGHASGDAVLQALSAASSSILRTEDVFARMGGEEFGILFPETGLEEAVQVAERIRKLVQHLKVTAENGATIRFTASLGVTSLREDDQSLESLLQRADRALYAAKEAGRNRVKCRD